MNVNDPYIIAAMSTFPNPVPDTEFERVAEELREADRDRAVVAHRGGRMLTIGRFRSFGWSPETEREAAELVTRTMNDVAGPRMLPQEAFDWPVYRTAMIAAALESLPLAQTHPCPDPGCDTGSIVDHQTHTDGNR